jgi:hypothetical protein
MDDTVVDPTAMPALNDSGRTWHCRGVERWLLVLSCSAALVVGGTFPAHRPAPSWGEPFQTQPSGA